MRESKTGCETKSESSDGYVVAVPWLSTTALGRPVHWLSVAQAGERHCVTNSRAQIT